jgi:heptosyltransferase-1
MRCVKPLSKDPKVTSIYWIVEERYASLFQDVDWIDEVITIDTYSLRKQIFSKKFVSEIKRIHSFQFDYLFDLQGNSKSLLLTLLLKAKEKIGFGWCSIPERIALFPLTIKKEVNLSSSICDQYRSILKTQFPNLADEVTEDTIQTKKGYFITIGSNWENKRLKIADWIQIIQLIWKKTGQICYLPVYSEKEEKEIEEILANCVAIAQKFPKSAFLDLKIAFKTSLGVIGVDSALIHLAALEGVKTYTIFGPSNASVYAPNYKQAYQGKCPEGIDFKKRCPRLRDCSHGNCLKELHLEALLNNIERFLSCSD